MASTSKDGQKMSPVTSSDLPIGSVRPLDSDGLRTLIHEHEMAMENTMQSLTKQEEYQAEYQALMNTLKHLPNKLSHDALVPVGPLAMGYGKLIHTNEITCHIGDNWFVQCSAKTAEKIASHRIQKSDEMLTKFRKEKELISAWIEEGKRQLREHEDTGTVEISEYYNEEQEQQWRQRHRENVRKHYQEKAKAKLEDTSATEGDDDKDLMERLELLELEEELSEYQAKQRQKPRIAGRSNSLTTEKSILKNSSLFPSTPNIEMESEKGHGDSHLEESGLSLPTEAFQKRRVSFDSSKDTIHSYPAEPRITGITSPVAEHEPREEIVVDAFKNVVIEKISPNVKKVEKTNISDDDDDEYQEKPPERLSLFKQRKLMKEGKL